MAMLPNFLIVGAQKSGTSTLAHYLMRHDQIFLPKRNLDLFDTDSLLGDLHFFDNDAHYRQGLPWYEQHFDPVTDEIAVGEKSPGYGYLSYVPQRIFQALPGVRLIWIFRNPVDRTYSHYWHAVRRGRELLSFEDAVKHEHERIKRNPWKGYMKRGLYAEQVERFAEYYSLERMHFILFEDFKREPSRVLSRVFRFLGVEDRPDIAAMDLRKNPGFLPRSVLLQYLAQSLFGDGRLFRIVRRFNRRASPGYPPLAPEMRQYLEAYFEEPNRRLAALTGLEVHRWRAGGYGRPAETPRPPAGAGAVHR